MTWNDSSDYWWGLGSITAHIYVALDVCVYMCVSVCACVCVCVRVWALWKKKGIVKSRNCSHPAWECVRCEWLIPVYCSMVGNHFRLLFRSGRNWDCFTEYLTFLPGAHRWEMHFSSLLRWKTWLIALFHLYQWTSVYVQPFCQKILLHGHSDTSSAATLAEAKA